MPESFKAFCNMVSLTAAKTRRIFDVSVAWVKLCSISIVDGACLEEGILRV
jgi:hypothetical protein